MSTLAIYDIFDHVGACVKNKSKTAPSHQLDHSLVHAFLEEEVSQELPKDSQGKSTLFSSFAARLLFLLLLFADVIWGVYTTALLGVVLVLNCLTGFYFDAMRRFQMRRYLSLKRSLVCAVALVVALFSPALGTMFACTYFLMYDKKGVEEFVPGMFREQFREFFN